MDNKIIAIIVAIIAVAAVGAFFLMGSGDTVTIGYLPSDHDAALFVADAQGQFASNGIKTNLVQFNNGGDLMTAMASGDVDVGYVGITPVLASIQKGVPVKVISAAQTDGSGLVVSKTVDWSFLKTPESVPFRTLQAKALQHQVKPQFNICCFNTI